MVDTRLASPITRTNGAVLRSCSTTSVLALWPRAQDDGGSFYEVALPIRIGAPYAFRGDLLGAVTGVDGFDLFFDFF